MEDVIHWVTEHKEESLPRRAAHRPPDPTANQAIGNVVQAERKKKHKKSKHKNPHHIGVWRAKED